MVKHEKMAVLFDFDGVVIDTEGQYSQFWHEIGTEYVGMEDLEVRIKGQTLVHIYEAYFAGKPEVQAAVTERLIQFERNMRYDYLPGVVDFVNELRSRGVDTAVVTSSNQSKMEAVYAVHPEIKTLFSRILTSEMFAASKPDPDCFLLGMRVFGTQPEHTYVFEDSLNGLRAGMASGATVIGLATTHSRAEIAPLCHCILDDFNDFSYDKLVSVHK